MSAQAEFSNVRIDDFVSSPVKGQGTYAANVLVSLPVKVTTGLSVSGQWSFNEEQKQAEPDLF